MTKTISIVVPVYNEEGNIFPLFECLRPVIAKIRKLHGYSVEVIVNDNKSSDGTLAQLERVAQSHDPREFSLRIFRFSRNVGFQRSILVGYCKARGDAVVQIDADLQDPPDLILEFLKAWEHGNLVVYGVRRKRPENLIMSLTRKAFYRILDRLSTDHLPPDSGDFRLVDRKLVDIVCAVRDQDPYLRGLIASLGFPQAGVTYDRKRRTEGKSKFGLGDLIKLAFDGITNHSAAPLRFSSYFAFIIAIAMAVFIIFYLYNWMLHGESLPVGFMTQTLLQLGGVGVVSLLFSIQGAYLSRIYSQLKHRPLAIIERRVEVDTGGALVDVPAVEVMWLGARVADDEI